MSTSCFLSFGVDQRQPVKMIVAATYIGFVVNYCRSMLALESVECARFVKEKPLPINSFWICLGFSCYSGRDGKNLDGHAGESNGNERYGGAEAV